jgi:hypothetical protein
MKFERALLSCYSIVETDGMQWRGSAGEVVAYRRTGDCKEANVFSTEWVVEVVETQEETLRFLTHNDSE